MRALLFLLSFSLLSATPSPAPLATYKVSGEVSFEAKVTTGVLDIHGTGGKVSGSLEEKKGKLSGVLNIKIGDLNAGSGFVFGARTEHMRQVLEAEKYPFATLKVKALETGDGPHTFKGDLTLKGVTKPVKGNYTVESSGAEKSAVASFHILLSDFGVGKIEKAQLVVDPDIAVKVDLKASP